MSTSHNHTKKTKTGKATPITKGQQPILADSNEGEKSNPITQSTGSVVQPILADSNEGKKSNPITQSTGSVVQPILADSNEGEKSNPITQSTGSVVQPILADSNEGKKSNPITKSTGSVVQPILADSNEEKKSNPITQSTGSVVQPILADSNEEKKSKPITQSTGSVVQPILADSNEGKKSKPIAQSTGSVVQPILADSNEGKKSKPITKSTGSVVQPILADSNEEKKSKPITKSQKIKVQTTVPWLGEIPAHWEVLKGKWLFEKQERPARGDDEIVTCFRDGTVTLRKNKKAEGYTVALKEHGYQGIRKGDLVIHNMDAFAGAIGVSDSDGKSTPVYSVCTPRINAKVNPYFYAYLLKNLAKSGFIQSLAKGIRERSTDFRFNDFALLLLTVPPFEEQTAIAQFLDHKTALIDKAIGIKEQQIVLLQERRQILIHRAVTRGLNPKVPLKPSGVEWIGDIPEGWEVKRLRYIADCFPSNVDKHSNKNEKTVRLCNYTDVYKNDFIIDSMELMIATATNVQIERFSLVKGDVVITKDSETANDIAVPAYVSENLTNVVCGYHLAVIRPNHKVYGKYLFRSLQSKVLNAQYEICSNGITRVALGNSDLKKGLFLVPPFTEQVAIADYLDQKTAQIATAISLKQQEIERLKEYKATLINSAVTGKIKIASPCPAKPTNRP